MRITGRTPAGTLDNEAVRRFQGKLAASLHRPLPMLAIAATVISATAGNA
jgi:hypothetical protein